jgi:hypothetical protein
LSFKKELTVFLSSPKFTAKIIKSEFLVSWYSFSISGISSLQGGHQLAQKFRKTFFPLNWLKVTLLPSKSVRPKSGARILELSLLLSLLDFSSLLEPSPWED